MFSEIFITSFTVVCPTAEAVAALSEIVPFSFLGSVPQPLNESSIDIERNMVQIFFHTRYLL